MQNEVDAQIEEEVSRFLSEEHGVYLKVPFKCSMWPRLAMAMMNHPRYGLLHHCPRPSLRTVARLYARGLSNDAPTREDWAAAKVETNADYDKMKPSDNGLVVPRELFTTLLAKFASDCSEFETDPFIQAESMSNAIDAAARGYAVRNNSAPVKTLCGIPPSYRDTKGYIEFMNHLEDMIQHPAIPGRIPRMEF